MLSEYQPSRHPSLRGLPLEAFSTNLSIQALNPEPSQYVYPLSGIPSILPFSLLIPLALSDPNSRIPFSLPSVTLSTSAIQCLRFTFHILVSFAEWLWRNKNVFIVLYISGIPVFYIYGIDPSAIPIPICSTKIKFFSVDLYLQECLMNPTIYPAVTEYIILIHVGQHKIYQKTKFEPRSRVPQNLCLIQHQRLWMTAVTM